MLSRAYMTVEWNAEYRPPFLSSANCHGQVLAITHSFCSSNFAFAKLQESSGCCWACSATEAGPVESSTVNLIAKLSQILRFFLEVPGGEESGPLSNMVRIVPLRNAFESIPDTLDSFVDGTISVSNS